MEIEKKIREIRESLPENVKIIAVSKTKPIETILKAYKSGQKLFGENKVQDLVQKEVQLPKDIEWHFIGHLQTNKVKFLVPFISLLHGVDSLKLLKTVNKEALKVNRIVSCLLQFHVATENTKFGLSKGEAEKLLCSEEFKQLQNIKICGVMGMASYSNDEELVRSEFRELKSIFEELKKIHFSESADFKEISMGMSGDYPLAVLEGSTMVRIGSKIFGARNY